MIGNRLFMTSFLWRRRYPRQSFMFWRCRLSCRLGGDEIMIAPPASGREKGVVFVAMSWFWRLRCRVSLRCRCRCLNSRYRGLSLRHLETWVYISDVDAWIAIEAASIPVAAVWVRCYFRRSGDYSWRVTKVFTGLPTTKMAIKKQASRPSSWG